jgi:voltage-gated potassium channel
VLVLIREFSERFCYGLNFLSGLKLAELIKRTVRPLLCTTVGYGDVVTVTPLGRLLGGITTIGGIAFFALPSSILAAGFFAERQSETKASTATEEAGTGPPKTPDDEPPRRCPHCGESIDTTGSEQQ